MTAVAVIDQLLTFLPLPAGWEFDDSAAEPAKSAPKRVYVWPRRLAPQKLEERGGRWDEADLRLRLLYAAPALGEPRAKTRTRDLSVVLDDLVDEVHAAVIANTRHPYWWDLYVDQVVYDAVRSDVVRGIGLDLVVRLNVPLPALASGS